MTKFRKAIAEYSKFAVAQSALGLALLRNGDRTGARDEFRQAIELDDKQEVGYVNLGKMSLEDGAYGESEKFLSRAVTLRPTDPEALTHLADAQFLEGKYSKVVVTSHRLHALNPRHGYEVTYFLAANALERTNHPE